MATLNDMPELKVLFDSLMKRKDEAEAEMAPLWEEYHKLQAQVDPFLVKQREIGTRLKEIKLKHNLMEVGNQLSAIAKAAGGMSISQGL